MADVGSTIEFDPQLYERNNPDVAAAGMDARTHWLEFGRDEERRGLRRSWLAPSFDEGLYRSAYPDADALIEEGCFCSGAEHWFACGREDMRRGVRHPPSDFDNAAYLIERPDVAAAVQRGVYVNGYDHWLQWGAAERRAANWWLVPDWHGAKADEAYEATGTAVDIDRDRADFWNANGYMILPGVIPPSLCDMMNERIHRLWAQRKHSAPPISIDIYLERPDSVRIPMRDAPADSRAMPYKINDMYLVDEVARSIALHDDVVPMLRWILSADPAMIGSLNFEKGSTQKFHTDTLYMPGKTAGGMTAAWFALEDVTEDAGPLLYYPGSHRIPLFRFSSGKSHQINAEVPHYDNYMLSQVADMQLVEQRFLPRKGDVLLWHERLFHGGSSIEDLAQTRKSLVVHYWRSPEMPADELIAEGGGFFWNRPPLA